MAHRGRAPRLEEQRFHEDSEAIFGRLRHLPGAVWLDSGKPRSLQGRFDIISALPQITIASDGARSIIDGNGASSTVSGDPFDHAWQINVRQGLIPEEYAHIPFTGGLIGYFDYDLGLPLHKLPEPKRQNSHPLMKLGWYGWALVVNHRVGKCWLVSHPACDQQILDTVRGLLQKSSSKVEPESSFSLTSPFQAAEDKRAYLQSLARINTYIDRGDCYQVNYALSHRATYQGDPWHAYRRLRRASPSPYSAYFNWNGRAVMSCSPERFLKVSVSQVEAKPIKGTIARGETLREDQERAVNLMNSRKDQAENLMIVDMLRNDLSRNCAPGSVRVPKLFALESFASVHHLVSTITGTLSPGRTPLDLLRDSFPGGSITGAPKKRAMEIIAELEAGPRGIYCGSIGYISATGRMDTNIAIRTLVADSGIIECRGGGGIVADSDPECEYLEAHQKIALLIKALQNS